MDDLVEVVSDGRPEIREGRAQMVKFQGGKDRSQEEKNGLTELALMEEVIANQCQLKLKGNQDAGSITETPALKVQASGKIRDLYRAMCEIPENPIEIGPKRSKKLKTNGNL